MEFGLIPVNLQLSQRINPTIEKIQPSNPTNSLVDGLASNDFIIEENLKKEEVDKTKQNTNKEFSKYQEVSLTNLNFGYNFESKDFFVKVARGLSESQFPTDDMMRLKAQLLSDAKTQNI